MTTEYLNNRVFEQIIARFQQSKREKNKYLLCLNDLEDGKKRGNLNNEICLRLVSVNNLYKESSKNYTESQEQLAYAFLTLSENIVNYAKFNLIDADDAVQEGVVICFEKIERFDPTRGRAFNYFTTCVLNCLRQHYRTARNYTELKRKFLTHLESNVESCLKNRKKNNNYQNFGESTRF